MDAYGFKDINIELEAAFVKSLLEDVYLWFIYNVNKRNNNWYAAEIGAKWNSCNPNDTQGYYNIQYGSGLFEIKPKRTKTR